MIDCNLWPMNILTKPVGSKDRKLLIHPKDAILRSGIRRGEDGRLKVIEDKAVKIPDGIYIPEVKEQGHRHLYCRHDNGDYHMYGRRLNVEQTYTDILEKVQDMPLPRLPRRTVVDFELIWPGHPDSEVTTCIKNCPEELRMKAFSCPIFEGHQLFGEHSPDWIQGRKRLLQLVGKENVVRGFKPICIGGPDKNLQLEHLLELAEKNEWEGFVLKQLANFGWWKLKGINEADVFITGFKVSDAETRMGMITGVTIGCYEYENNRIIKEVDMGKVAGFNLEQINDMTAAYKMYGDNSVSNPYMYRPIRVIYQEIAGKGALKHGFFDGWRDDKSPESCTMEQFK